MAVKEGIAAADTLIGADTIDSAAQDTAVHGDTIPMLVMTPPAKTVRQAEEVSLHGGGESWVMMGIVVLFLLLCLKSRNNLRFLGALWHNLIDNRRRSGQGAASTVRESSFMVVLNCVCACAIGMVLYLCRIGVGGMTGAGVKTPILLATFGISLAYCLFMPLAYRVWGWTFADAKLGASWSRSFLAMQALAGLILFPIAIAGLFYPANAWTVALVAACVYGCGKLLFIYKSLRFFWNDFDSQIVFLYYLCTLEIVPLVLMYVLALLIPN